MQPEPPKVSQNKSLTGAQSFCTSNQHGLSDEHEESSASLLAGEDAAMSPYVAVEPDAASASSEGSRRGPDTYAGRLTSSSSSRSSQRSSPVNRIEEYERSRTYSRRTSDRIMFQVVSSTRG